MGTPGGNEAGSRRGRRRVQPVTPRDVGTWLVEGRNALNLSLADVHDRTGVPWDQLEALEEGRLDAFTDRRAALTAARRFADLVRVDVAQVAKTVEEHWQGRLQAEPAAAVSATGPRHLSRYPGDTSHLMPFTRTGPVPAVGAAAPRGAPPVTSMWRTADPSVTGAYPAVPPLRIRPVRPKPPLVLRMAIWVVVACIVAAAAGLVIHRYEPRWLVDIGVVKQKSHPTTTTNAPATSQGGTRTTSGTGLVTATPSDTATSTVTVHAAHYQVAVTGIADAWIEVSTPQSFAAVFGGLVHGGETKVFSPQAGQLTIQFSGAQVTATVKVAGKTVRGFNFQPPVVPYTLHFAAAG